ncbi:MAG TPA: GNAT family N-acetyltransferase [Moraxellaceae bacterium]
MELSYRPVLPAQTDRYLALFRTCFPGAGHFSADYLRWLYAENPDGEVLGFDAWDGETLAAHYACVPARARIEGEVCPVLLSLNTATAPAYQGRGLFTRLAGLTYERAQALGVRAVYGVANANSTPGFVRKLGFTLVSPLAARVGIGRPCREDWSRLRERAGFSREWSAEALAWRLRNPSSPVAAPAGGDGLLLARTPWPLLSACAPGPAVATAAVATGAAGPLRVFIGLLPAGARPSRAYLDIPGCLRPSPLNLIYRDLHEPDFRLDPARVLASFLDFDAF